MFEGRFNPYAYTFSSKYFPTIRPCIKSGRKSGSIRLILNMACPEANKLRFKTFRRLNIKIRTADR